MTQNINIKIKLVIDKDNIHEDSLITLNNSFHLTISPD